MLAIRLVVFTFHSVRSQRHYKSNHQADPEDSNHIGYYLQCATTITQHQLLAGFFIKVLCTLNAIATKSNATAIQAIINVDTVLWPLWTTLAVCIDDTVLRYRDPGHRGIDSQTSRIDRCRFCRNPTTSVDFWCCCLRREGGRRRDLDWTSV
ncbi:hypothetical protein B0H65DRAFT_312379 [Neurospora tetraspora]|uniref:Uncharacterized protein n=1 Tax=Neurospora tetraspora TaxID=94610 RepID=A0AAE0J6Y1_9PEZI|nr:hypothetical protein B0H65DRAFT_312379 [Neurospora tetraspora]